jgi:hypothetical protein
VLELQRHRIRVPSHCAIMLECNHARTPNTITLELLAPSHFFNVFFHFSLFASSFVSLEVNASKFKLYCYHCNVCCSLLYWGGKTTWLQLVDVGFHKSSYDVLLLESLLKPSA